MKTIITLFAITAAFASAETPAKEATAVIKPAEESCAKEGNCTMVVSGPDGNKQTMTVQGGPKDAATPAKTDGKCCVKGTGNTIVVNGGANPTKGTITASNEAKDAATPTKTDVKSGAKGGTIISSGNMVVNGAPTTITIKPCDKGCVPPPTTGKSCCDAAPAAATDKAEEKKEVEKK